MTLRNSITAVVLGLVVLLGGCSGNDDLHRWVDDQKAKPKAPVEPLPVIKTFETFEYTDQGLRDPFGPSPSEQRESASNGPHPDQNRPREPLESYPLDALHMVGTIGMGNKIEGLVKDPDGVIHRVHAGNYLGQNYGRITGISEDHIDVVELVPNGSGGWMERPATVALGEATK